MMNGLQKSQMKFRGGIFEGTGDFCDAEKCFDARDCSDAGDCSGVKNYSDAGVRKGFTMVEFSLATAFVGILLLTISTVVLNMVSIYQKGLTIKSVNSTGRALVDDIESAVRAGGTVFISESSSDLYYRAGDSGAFCSGSYTYLWNTRSIIKDGKGKDVSYNGERINDYRLVKVLDSNRDICRNWSSRWSGVETITLENEPEELLSSSDINLYIYSFSVDTVLEDALNTQTLMLGGFQLGTDREDNEVKITNCEQASGTEFCALGKFKFAARTAGKENTGQ